jgi:alpha-mannosidase
LEREELSRAFDLLADARNHVYSVEIYVIDITLLADTTLGESLRGKLAAGVPSNVLVTGEQIERIALDHPESLAELKRALEAGTASIVGGTYRGVAAADQSPESLLAEFRAGQRAAHQHLNREYEVFGQFVGYRGALHAAFDGGRLPKADQRKTNWGVMGSSIEAVSATPLDVSRPETWLKLAERLGDSIAHDHVATIVLAGWPGTACEYFDDLRCASRYGSVLGKLMTLDEYFRTTRAADDWTNFYPREYPVRSGTEVGANAISSRVEAYRQSVRDVQRQLVAGLAAMAGFRMLDTNDGPPDKLAVINPWNIAHTAFVETSATGTPKTPTNRRKAEILAAPLYLPDIPGCGYATLASAAGAPPVALVEGATLRNEWMELTVSAKTGGIQSLRRHRDRHTRVSQRLVFHHETTSSPAETHMVADKVGVTRNDLLVGEIASDGRLVGAGGELLARFKQRVRALRGMPAMIVDVELAPVQLPGGDIWKSYIASRLAWAEDALAFRRGQQWSGLETSHECMETPEWVEVDDGNGRITCFALGLPFHRIVTATRLDSLFVVAGEEQRRFQFALGLDLHYPTHSALALLSAWEPMLCVLADPPSSQRGWFVHVGAKNVLCTQVEPLRAPDEGIRLRLLETEGRETRTTVTAFRPVKGAWISDFRGNRTAVLSVSDGRAEIEIGSCGWLQIEAEW